MGFPIRSGLTAARTTDAGEDLSAPFGLLGFGMGVGAKPVTEASVSETSLGRQMIQGVSVIGTRVVRTIPAGVLGNDSPITSTRDTWLGAAKTASTSPTVKAQPASIGFDDASGGRFPDIDARQAGGRDRSVPTRRNQPDLW